MSSTKHLNSKPFPKKERTHTSSTLVQTTAAATDTLPSRTEPDFEPEYLNEDLGSMVVIDEDFDVEAELQKAQKEGSNMFKVLSMSFYEKRKSQPLPSQQPEKTIPITSKTKIPVQEPNSKAILQKGEIPRPNSSLKRTISKGQGKTSGESLVKLSQDYNVPFQPSNPSRIPIKRGYQIKRSNEAKSCEKKDATGKSIEEIYGGTIIPPKMAAQEKVNNANNANKRPSSPGYYHFSVLQHKNSSPGRISINTSYYQTEGLTERTREKSTETTSNITNPRQMRTLLRSESEKENSRENFSQGRRGKNTSSSKEALTFQRNMQQDYLTGQKLKQEMLKNSMIKAYRGNSPSIKDQQANIGRRISTENYTAPKIHLDYDKFQGNLLYLKSIKTNREKSMELKNKPKPKELDNKTQRLKFIEYKEILDKMDLYGKLRNSSKDNQKKIKPGEGGAKSFRKGREGRDVDIRLKTEGGESTEYYTYRSKEDEFSSERRCEVEDLGVIMQTGKEAHTPSYPQSKTSKSSKLRKLKLNLDRIGKGKHEIEPNVGTLREYSTTAVLNTEPNESNRANVSNPRNSSNNPHAEALKQLRAKIEAQLFALKGQDLSRRVLQELNTAEMNM